MTIEIWQLVIIILSAAFIGATLMGCLAEAEIKRLKRMHHHMIDVITERRRP